MDTKRRGMNLNNVIRLRIKQSNTWQQAWQGSLQYPIPTQMQWSAYLLWVRIWQPSQVVLFLVLENGRFY